MRLNIATKLFFGFLVVIFLNVFFFVLISKIENINSLTRILKKQHEIKNELLRIKTLHRVQGPSIISYERLQRAESVANFHEIHSKIVTFIDTINKKIDSIQQLDSAIILSSRIILTYNNIINLKNCIDSIILYNMIYANTFDSIVKGRENNSLEKNLKIKRDVLNQADYKLSSLLDSSEAIIDIQTNHRLKEVEIRVSNVKKITIVIISGVTLFAIVFGFIFSKSISNSLIRLKDAAANIGRGDFNVNPHVYPNDEIGDLAVAFFDMAIDLKNKENELIKSKRMAAIGEVVASVNHEINNPLMIISGNAQFLEMILEGYPLEVRERVQTILEETERISKVTRKLREIKNPVVEDYTSTGEQMINLDKSAI